MKKTVLVAFACAAVLMEQTIWAETNFQVQIRTQDAQTLVLTATDAVGYQFGHCNDGGNVGQYCYVHLIPKHVDAKVTLTVTSVDGTSGCEGKLYTKFVNHDMELYYSPDKACWGNELKFAELQEKGGSSYYRLLIQDSQSNHAG